MSWSKREVDSNIVILGDGEGNVARVGGLLVSIRPDPRYSDNKRYELVQQDGTSKSVAGSAAINSQLGPADVGKFVKLAFAGWGSSGNGKFKKIEVQVWDGPPSPEMLKWPRYSELNGTKSNSDPGPAQPVGDDSDDDLPF